MAVNKNKILCIFNSVLLIYFDLNCFFRMEMAVRKRAAENRMEIEISLQCQEEEGGAVDGATTPGGGTTTITDHPGGGVDTAGAAAIGVDTGADTEDPLPIKMMM